MLSPVPFSKVCFRLCILTLTNGIQQWKAWSRKATLQCTCLVNIDRFVSVRLFGACLSNVSVVITTMLCPLLRLMCFPASGFRRDSADRARCLHEPRWTLQRAIVNTKQHWQRKCRPGKCQAAASGLGARAMRSHRDRLNVR